jgi:hypothetical protein
MLSRLSYNSSCNISAEEENAMYHAHTNEVVPRHIGYVYLCRLYTLSGYDYASGVL